MINIWKKINPPLKQKIILFASVCGVFSLVWGGVSYFSPPPAKEKMIHAKETHHIKSPAESFSSSESWVARVEKKSDELKDVLESSQAENKVLMQRLELLEEIIKNDSKLKTTEDVSKVSNGGGQGSEVDLGLPFSQVGSSIKKFASSDSEDSLSKNSKDFVSDLSEGVTPQEKFIHLSVEETKTQKTAENYVPATTYIRAVLTSGMAVSTAESASSNPKPVTLRCVDDGNLSRGWRSKLKDATINASCYGDISSERAVCRLVDMSWVEENGDVMERKIEGWIIGPDGREGVRGRVVDRSGQLARDSFIAGFMGGVSDFFKYQSTQASPQGLLGLTNPLSTGDSIKGSAGQGMSNSFDKLADFYIKRAEAMSPVILINGGQVVDVVFKKGFFLQEEEGEYHPLGAETESNKQPQGEF